SISPLHNVPLAPDAEVEAWPLIVMGVLAVLLSVIGLLGLRRRDMVAGCGDAPAAGRAEHARQLARGPSQNQLRPYSIDASAPVTDAGTAHPLSTGGESPCAR